MVHSATTLGQILIKNHIISNENLEEAIKCQKTQGGLIGIILIERGFIDEHELVIALEQQQKLRTEE